MRADSEAWQEDREEVLQRQKGASDELASLRREVKRLKAEVTDCKHDVIDAQQDIKGIKKREAAQELARKRPREEPEAQDDNDEESYSSDSSDSVPDAGDVPEVDFGKARDSKSARKNRT